MSEPSSTLEEGLAVARSALEGGRPAEAAVGLKALTRQFPGEAEPYRLLSIAFHQAGDRAAALDAARSAVVARPESAGCQYQLGVTAYDRGDRETARAAYEKALSLRPGLAPAWVNLGRLHDDSFRFDDALICYERALMLTPDQPIAHTNRGNTLLALERYAEAATAFSRALQAAPSHAAALLGQATALAEMGLLEQVAELPLAGTAADRGPVREWVAPRAGGDLVIRWFEGRHTKPEWLAHEAKALGRRLVAALDAGASVGEPIGIGLCHATLRAEGERLVVCIPDLRRDPTRHRTGLVSFYLQSVVVAGLLAAQVRQPPDAVSWLQTVHLSPDALDAPQVLLERRPPIDPADSGWWMAGPTPSGAPLRLPISTLIQVRPALTRALTLPVAWRVVVQGERLVSARDASGQERLAATGPAQM